MQQRRTQRTLEGYLLQQHLGKEYAKRVKDVTQDEDLKFLHYTLDGESKVLDVHMWAPAADMYLTNVYTDMLSQGYLTVPINGGWAVTGGEEVYYLDPDLGTCTCRYNAYKSGTSCKHMLMVQGYLCVTRRVSEIRQDLGG